MTIENHPRLGSPALLDWMIVDLHTGEPLKVEGTTDPLEFGSYREASFWLSEKYGQGDLQLRREELPQAHPRQHQVT